MSDVQSFFGDVGGAVNDLFGMEGSDQAAGAYTKAAKIAQSNEALTLRSTAIQEQQLTEQTGQVLGTEQADVSGAGFGAGGSAGDLLRSSAFQAALSKQLVQAQGESTALGYEQQANAYQGQAAAAKTQAKGQGIGGILNGVAAVASITVICTELVAQHKLPARWVGPSFRKFASYPREVQEGYHAWAIPTVRHMRQYPDGIVSRIMEEIFVPRSENIAAHAGVRSAKKRWRGALSTAILWPLCYAIGFVRLRLSFKTNWEGLYNGR